MQQQYFNSNEGFALESLLCDPLWATYSTTFIIFNVVKNKPSLILAFFEPVPIHPQEMF